MTVAPRFRVSALNVSLSTHTALPNHGGLSSYTQTLTPRLALDALGRRSGTPISLAPVAQPHLPMSFPDLWAALSQSTLRYHLTLDTPNGCVLVFRRSKQKQKNFALTPREQRMFLRTLLGDRQKLIAADAEIASSTVANCLRSAMMKLGFRTRLEAAPLAALTLSHQFNGSDRPCQFEIFAARSGELVFAKMTCPEWSRFPQLTTSEQEICKKIVAGKSNLQISRERNTTVGTVQNQVASLFRKIGVSSRFELLNRVFGRHDDNQSRQEETSRLLLNDVASTSKGLRLVVSATGRPLPQETEAPGPR